MTKRGADSQLAVQAVAGPPGDTHDFLIPPLPNEVAMNIYRYLKPDVLMRFSSVNRLWRKTVLRLITNLRSMPYYTSHRLLLRMPNLQSMRILYHDYIPQSILRNLRSLTKLTVHGPGHINDDTLASLKNLTDLKLKECNGITSKSIILLQKLKILIIEDMHPLGLSPRGCLPELETVMFINTPILPSVRGQIRLIAPKIKLLHEQWAQCVHRTEFTKDS